MTKNILFSIFLASICFTAKASWWGDGTRNGTGLEMTHILYKISGWNKDPDELKTINIQLLVENNNDYNLICTLSGLIVVSDGNNEGDIISFLPNKIIRKKTSLSVTFSFDKKDWGKYYNFRPNSTQSKAACIVIDSLEEQDYPNPETLCSPIEDNCDWMLKI